MKAKIQNGNYKELSSKVKIGNYVKLVDGDSGYSQSISSLGKIKEVENSSERMHKALKPVRDFIKGRK